MMGRIAVVAILMIIAGFAAGLIAFEYSIDRTDDLDEFFFAESKAFAVPPKTDDVCAPEIKGIWMPQLRAGHDYTVREVVAEPDDETFELSYAIYAQPDSIVLACLGEKDRACFGVGHDARNGWRRIGWYDEPGGKQLVAWNDAGDDYYSFAVRIRRDAGELIALVNGREAGRIPAAFVEGPIVFHVGYAPVRLDKVAVVAHAELFSSRVQAGSFPYLAFLFGFLLVGLLFLIDRSFCKQIGLESPGVWIALGYGSLILYYWAADHPLQNIRWDNLVRLIWGVRALSLPLFPEMFGEQVFSVSDKRWRWLPQGALERALALFFLLPVAMMTIALAQNGLLAAEKIPLLLRFGWIFPFVLFLPFVFARLLHIRERLARRTVYLASLPLMFYPLRYLPIEPSPIGSNPLPHWALTLTMLGLFGFLTAVARLKGTPFRWLVAGLLCTLVALESENAGHPPYPRFFQVDGERFAWSPLQINDLLNPPDINPPEGRAPLVLLTASTGDLADWPLQTLVDAGYYAPPLRAAGLNAYQMLLMLENEVLPKTKPVAVAFHLGQNANQGARARLLWPKLQKITPMREHYTALPATTNKDFIAWENNLYRTAYADSQWFDFAVARSALARLRWLRQLDIDALAYCEAREKLTDDQLPQNTLPPTDREVLARFAELGRLHNFTPLFLPACDTAGNFLDPYLAELMQQVAAENALPFLDLRETVRERQTPFFDPLSLSEQAKEKIVAAVAEALKDTPAATPE